MNAINMPGFTAETSVYQTSRHYRMTEASALGGGAIRPSLLDRRCYTACKSTCYCLDLFGSARGACFRQCNQECAEDCTV
jgi:hypothetical protein